MALSSPGVQVSVIDESFYTPAEPGTVPMIFVATASNKSNGAGTGIAPGTLAANAGKPYLVTSQRDLVETFGDPVFQTDNNNNPIHAGELNEYGLQAAYSLLGVSNRAYVVRADIDLSELEASAEPPAANPAPDTYWFDTQNTAYGIFEWNSAAVTAPGGQTFGVRYPTVITDETKLVGNTKGNTPKTSVGAIGDYAINATTNLNTLYYKSPGNTGAGIVAGTWVEVGSDAWKASWSVVRGTANNPTFTIGDTLEITVDGTPQSTLTLTTTDFVSEFNTAFSASVGITAKQVDGAIEFYSTGSTVAFTNGTLVGTIGLDSTKTYQAPELTIAPHTSVPDYKASSGNKPTGSIWVKTTEPNLGARWRLKRFNGETQLWEDIAAPIYASGHAAINALDLAGGGANLTVGAAYVKSNVGESSDVTANFKIFRRVAAGETTATSDIIDTGSISAGSYDVSFQESKLSNGVIVMSTATTIGFSLSSVSGDADDIAAGINAQGFDHIVAEVNAQNRVVIKHTAGGEIRISDPDGLFAEMGITVNTANVYAAPAGDTANDYLISLWKATDVAGNAFAIPSPDAPTALTEDGALWYNSIVDEVDIMIKDNSGWVGYYNYDFGDGAGLTDPAGPIVSASEPVDGDRSDGNDLVTGDIWIDTSDLLNYPTIYKYNNDQGRWNLVDKGDQTTEDGILFADARYNTSGATSDEAGEISALLTSDYVDPDAPDPALYPKGMMLFNLRRSGFNVKRFVRNYIDKQSDNIRFNDENMGQYYENRWVTESGNQADGSGSFGQIAQRKVVVQSLQAMVNSNDEIRDDESRIFNLMACPGYPELIGEMISLNYDRGLSAFIVGDSPARLTPDATSLNEWGTNVNLAVEDNEKGLVSMDEYMAVFYPWGFTSDNFGNNVVVPPSHMMLRTMALSDQVSYPWFAPAGTRRGGITNATATGYINGEGEFVSVALNEGQRDTLYGVSVNPITFITGSGLVNFGQKTRARNASSLDRINVARLVIYLRSQLNKLAKPYIFEPNDKITRDEIKQAAESLMLELVGQRALYDYLVVCDESNNTPSRIDRNELYLDIAIEPVKAVEFIYIPLRLKNTGEISGL
jgi:hypothetical protein